MKTLKNDLTIIEYNAETKEILGRCLKDKNNLPAFYNKKVRSIKKAWETLENNFNDKTTMSKTMNILEPFNLGLKCVFKNAEVSRKAIFSFSSSRPKY